MNEELRRNSAPGFIPCGDAFEKIQEISGDALEKLISKSDAENDVKKDTSKK